MRRFGIRCLAFGVALSSAAALAGCEGRPRTSSGESERSASAEEREARAGGFDGAAVAEIDLTRGLPEAPPPSFFGPGQRRSHVDLVSAIRALSEASTTKGVLVKLGTASVGLARAQEIAGLLGGLRKKKIPVVCHADEYNNGTLLLASGGCDRLWLSPPGGVEAVGIAAQLVYARSLLDRYHVGVDFLQVGKYKGAEEPFTRDGPSDEARASLQGALGGLRDAWLATIVEGRGDPKVAALVEDGPFTAAEAKKNGLVDAIGYFEDARDDARHRAGTERVVPRFGSGETPPGAQKGFSGILRSITGAHGGAARVALVVATGAITMSASRSLLGSSEGISEHELGKLVQKLTADEGVKAVVVRIDSPGGSALASDLLWHKLMKLRAKKPIVFSVGNMAASGGYYLASTGNAIVAEPTSIVGSIGVVGGKLAFGKALEEIGVHAETIGASPDPGKASRAAYMSILTPWDAATRERVLATMTAIYDLFLERVAEGRGVKIEDVSPSAEGQVFGGVEGKKRGLVDAIGGLTEAIALARSKASLPEDTPIELIGDAPSFTDLFESGGGEDAEERAAAAVGRSARGAFDFGAELPEVQGFVGSMSPLLSGEKVLTALPFGLVVR